MPRRAELAEREAPDAAPAVRERRPAAGEPGARPAMGSREREPQGAPAAGILARDAAEPAWAEQPPPVESMPVPQSAARPGARTAAGSPVGEASGPPRRAFPPPVDEAP